MANLLSTVTELFDNTNKRTLLYAGSGVLCTIFVGRKLNQYRKHQQYMVGCDSIRRKRDEQVAQLTQDVRAMDLDLQKVERITGLCMAELIDKLKSGGLSAVDVLHAYQKVALDAHEKTNCLTVVLSEAEEWARSLDQGASRDGLLYGVPISIKDNFPTRGHFNSRGCLRLTSEIIEEDCLLINALKAEGAVPFVKTNVPQLLMGVETSNALYGRTCNPHDTTRSCGGSSGGEAALIAAGGSILGVGSDIGGSVRIPASHCGICSLKPTSGRITLLGSVPHGQRVIKPCWGPMARDVDSLVLVLRTALQQRVFDEDKTVPPMPFDDSIFLSEKPLTIGYYTDDGMYPAAPPMARAVLETKEILEAKGHTLVPWSPPEVGFAIEGTARSFTGHKGCVLRSYLGDEQADKSISRLIDAFIIPRWLRNMVIWYANRKGEPGLARTLAGFAGVNSVEEWFDWTIEAKLYSQRFGANWRKHKLDAVICPSFHHPAPKLGYTVDIPYVHTNFVSHYNLVDYAAGVVPVTRVSEEDMMNLKQFVVTGPKATSEYIAKDMEGTVGLPITVQCVAPMWREELCLRLLKEIEDGVHLSKK